MITVLPAAVRGRLSIVAVLAALLLSAGCAGPRIVTPQPPPIPDGGAAVPEDAEIVLSDGTQLVANTDWGPIKIEAGPGLRRVYTWRGLRRGVVLEPRKTRFAGSKGIHFEGEPPVWAPANGINRVKVEEGQRRFETMDDALIWMQIRRLRYTYNNSGLVVGWKPDGDTLKVELWQFYIDGEQPDSMPNGDDLAITTGPIEVVPQQMKPVLVYQDGTRKPIPEPAATVAAAVSTEESADTDAQQPEDKAESEQESWFQRNIAAPIADAFGSDDTPDDGGAE